MTVVIASGGGKVGNLGLVFHFSRAAKPGCGNVGISRRVRDFQGAVERVGKPVLLFHAFHGPVISTALSRLPALLSYSTDGRGASIFTRRKSWLLAAAIFRAHSVSLILCATRSSCCKLCPAFK